MRRNKKSTNNNETHDISYRNQLEVEHKVWRQKAASCTNPRYGIIESEYGIINTIVVNEFIGKYCT